MRPADAPPRDAEASARSMTSSRSRSDSSTTAGATFCSAGRVTDGTSPSEPHARIRARACAAGRSTGRRSPVASAATSTALDGEVVRCPWHGWEFDVKSGAGLMADASARIASYEVTVVDGDVYVARGATRRR